MSPNDLTWTNKKKKDAEPALSGISDLVNKYGMELILEALIEHNNVAILGAQVFGVTDECLVSLKKNLQKSLEEYRDKHNEFGNRG